jgi:NDP-sugar pyrophosphorylase family protein
MENLTVIVPCAGNGSRFAQAGYTKPKPFIEDPNRIMMLEHVVNSLDLDARHVYLFRKEHVEQYPDEINRIMLLKPDSHYVVVEKPTGGAAETVLLARDYIDNGNPVCVANSDQVCRFDKKKLENLLLGEDYCASCVVLTFPNNDPKWSYAKLLDDPDYPDHIEYIREKEVVSDQATVGVYFWACGRDLVRSIEDMIFCGCKVLGEHYLAPSINFLLLDDFQMAMKMDVEMMRGVGTPQDWEKFINGK